MTYTILVQQDLDGELYIELPPELLEQLKWTENTNLVWVIEDDKILLRKSDDSSYEA